MDQEFQRADKFGPFKTIHVQEPSIGLLGVLVVDNVAAGPSIGGVRMAPDVSTHECARLARAMTFKNAAAGLRYGGGKAALVGDPGMPIASKERLIRAFACALREIEQYIFAPDMGTDEQCMAWVRDEIGRVVGLPRVIGGIPLDEVGATGFGLLQATRVALRDCDFELEGARVAIQGYGAVGRHAARFLAEQGARIVAVSDSRGAVQASEGLDLEVLNALKAEGESVDRYAGGQQLPADALIDVDCDIWIPAARPDAINETNVDRLKARLVVQGANIPVTATAEALLHQRGVLCVPDFIANAGGVICAATEYEGGSEMAAFAAIEEKILRNTEQVLEAARQQGITPRAAALAFAERHIEESMGYRRWTVF